MVEFYKMSCFQSVLFILEHFVYIFSGFLVHFFVNVEFEIVSLDAAASLGLSILTFSTVLTDILAHKSHIVYSLGALSQQSCIFTFFFFLLSQTDPFLNLWTSALLKSCPANMSSCLLDCMYGLYSLLALVFFFFLFLTHSRVAMWMLMLIGIRLGFLFTIWQSAYKWSLRDADATGIHIDALCHVIVLEREDLFLLSHLHIDKVDTMWFAAKQSISSVFCKIFYTSLFLSHGSCCPFVYFFKLFP